MGLNREMNLQVIWGTGQPWGLEIEGGNSRHYQKPLFLFSWSWTASKDVLERKSSIYRL